MLFTSFKYHEFESNHTASAEHETIKETSKSKATPCNSFKKQANGKKCTCNAFKAILSNPIQFVCNEKQ